MRMRNFKNKEEILDSSNYVIKNPEEYISNWHKVFKNDNPIYIEIGMGKGKFIVENARRYKNINFIGIEKFDSVLARAVKKIEDDLDNLLLIRMDALDIDKVFSHEVDRIYLNFSDPWPKKRQIKRRLTSDIFLSKYNSIFEDKKEIRMRTDNKDLFSYSLESVSRNGYILERVFMDLHSSEDDLITTEYEDKFDSVGMPIYSFIAVADVQNSKK